MQTRITLVLLALLLAAGPTTAQPALDDAWVAFDLGGASLCTTTGGFVVFSMYVLAYPSSDMSGWEMGVSISDPSWNILSTTLNPPEALNVGSVGNFIVGLGVCLASANQYTPLVIYQLGYFVSPSAPSDVTVCLGTSTPSSLQGSPGYASCTDELIALQLPADGLGLYPDGCGVINPTSFYCPVGAERQSFGAFKARY